MSTIEEEVGWINQSSRVPVLGTPRGRGVDTRF